MSDLIEFLRARLDEEEAAQQQPLDLGSVGLGEQYGSIYEAPGGGWHTQQCAYRMIEHYEACVCHVPARTLAEIAAKRRLIAPHGPGREGEDRDGEPAVYCTGHNAPTLYPCRTLLIIASPYADHPEFDPAWEPS